MTERIKIDTMLRVTNLRDAQGLAREIEEQGYDGLWAAEKDHDPYLLVGAAAVSTSTVTVGTAIALAFNRSPMTIAQTAWNLQAASGGRFVLGLGSQVRAHIERRFSAAWDRPVDRMREVVLSLKAIWDCWQTGGALDFEGEFYRFNLMTPAFTPPHLESLPPPIYLGGVNPKMLALAGELCDGIHVHPFHSIAYLRDIVLPALEAGADKGSRSLDHFKICVSAFVVTDEVSYNAVRDQMSFYGSTKAYRPVLALHGWEDIGRELARLARGGRWTDMPALITDEMMSTFAIMGAAGEARRLAQDRYGGLAHRVTINEGPAANRLPQA